jgi:DNA (cytosine-5)-methyltransferase 1
MRALGYSPQLFLLNAADCGVPQYRERVFFCAIKASEKKQKLLLKPNHRHVSCKEATDDLIITSEELARNKHKSNTDLTWWPKTPQGKNYEFAVVKAGLPNKLWNHKRLNGITCSNTLTATHAMINHWSEPRSCTLREWKRFGSFPDDYKCESEDIGKYMIGMSVPPKMMEYVAKEVLTQWLQKP